MHQELIKQAIGLFDTPEKWNTFLELYSNKDNIRRLFNEKLRIALRTYFDTNPINNWKYEIWGQEWEFVFYIDKLGKDNIRYWFSGDGVFLWFNNSIYNSEKINNLLSSNEFALVRLQFGRIDRYLYHVAEKLHESGNYCFNSPYDGHFDYDKLAFHAYYNTEMFLEQIIEKVYRFCNNEQVTKLLLEIDLNCKL